jgi:hypothetical protein
LRTLPNFRDRTPSAQTASPSGFPLMGTMAHSPFKKSPNWRINEISLTKLEIADSICKKIV